MAVGIKAMPIMLLGAGVFDGVKSFGCHFMVRVFLRDTGKAIVVDPSFNAYFTDEVGNVLDRRELAEMIRKGKNYIYAATFLTVRTDAATPMRRPFSSARQSTCAQGKIT